MVGHEPPIFPVHLNCLARKACVASRRRRLRTDRKQFAEQFNDYLPTYVSESGIRHLEQRLISFERWIVFPVANGKEFLRFRSVKRKSKIPEQCDRILSVMRLGND